MEEFKKLGLNKKLLDVLEELKFETPSEIQRETIPLIVDGRDVIGNAATGSGKTLAFTSGIIKKVTPKKGIQALVLTPTRELAEQVAKVIRMFSKKIPLTIQEVYGGVGMGNQIMGAKKAEVIVGTPGRILDHLGRKTLNFSKLKVLILDEADRMVDMGFLPDVEKIIKECPKERQTLLFSATSSPDVDNMSKKYMKEPKQITVEKYVDPSKLKQYYYDVPSNAKFSLLVHLLKKEKSGTIMIFCNTRMNVDIVAKNLKRYDIVANAIHGGLNQNKRSKIMENFQKSKTEILVCTDVAARGLDISGVTHVYNYDSPKSSEEYIHRIGRTARAGEEGLAISLVSNRDYANFRKVREDDALPIVIKELPSFEKLTPKFNERDDNFRRRDGNRRGPPRRDSRGPSRGGQRRDSRSPSRGSSNRSFSGGFRGGSNRSFSGRPPSKGPSRDSRGSISRDSRHPRGGSSRSFSRPQSRDSRRNEKRDSRKPRRR